MTCLIVAELGASHQGSLDHAKSLIGAAQAAGAHAVKLQTWAPGKMVLDSSLVLRTGPWAGTNLSELYEKAHLPWEAQREAFAYAKSIGIECFSSAFDQESVDFLEGLECPRYKIASFELVDLPLIQYAALTKKPLILSTGMATRDEVKAALEAAQDAGARDITVLKCTSAYPADGSSANLATMRAIRTWWSQKIGLSDHTPTIGTAIAAVAMGADMIEKHIRLPSTGEAGLDDAFAITPSALQTLVVEAHQVARAWGKDNAWGPTEHEAPQLELRRSLYYAQDLEAGAYVPAEAVRSARPARGVPPKFLKRVLGSRLKRSVRAGEPVAFEDLEMRSWPGAVT